MSDTHAAAAAPPKRAYTPRQSNLERAESKREAVLASVAPAPEELRLRALRQAKAAELERVEKLAALMDEHTPDAVRRTTLRQLATLKGEAAAEVQPLVWVTIRPKGAGKISMGRHVPQVGDAHYEARERLQLPVDTAKKYEDLAWVDVDGGD